MTMLALAIGVSAPASATILTYQVTNYDNDGTHGVYLRNSSNVNNVNRDSAHYVTYGTSVQLVCAEWGSSVGPHTNTAWDYVRVLNGPNAGKYGHLSEHWLNTPVNTNQHVSGEPACGSTPTPPSPTPTPIGGGNASLPIWFGSPVNGHFPTDASSFPQNHHLAYGGDWSMDIPAGAGQTVQVYAAPQDGRSTVTAKVLSVAPACASHRISDGGYVVRVGFFNGAAEIGYVAYAHLNPSVSAGQSISRWGGVLGTVGSYTRSSCWTGSHSHVEAYNVHNYSCFNGTFHRGIAIAKSNFIGRLGGRYATHQRQACP